MIINSGKVNYIDISEERAGQRLDNFLLSRFKDIPKSHIYQIVRTGQVRVNKKRAKVTYRLVTGDRVRVPPLQMQHKPLPTIKNQQKFPLEQLTLYEDKRLLIINKPAGMAVHGGSGINFGVIESIRLLHAEAKDWELAHRLDRETSGCLIIAKKRSMLRQLHELLREGKVDKRYLALLAGQVKLEQQDVCVPLVKNQLMSGERMVFASAEGKASRTGFAVKKRFDAYTLVEAELHTGRTHQIRVHAAYIGHPIVGDEKYGDKEVNKAIRALGNYRLFLHAHRLVLPLAEGECIEVTAPLDEKFQKILGSVDNSTMLGVNR